MRDLCDAIALQGAAWGENGYARLARNVGQKDGECGIASLASYVTIK